MASLKKDTAYYHLPGLFEFYELYRVFLPLFYEHREYFYDWCDIGSIYGAPADCLWGGGRVGFGDHDSAEILALLREYGISARLTFSNSLLREEHLSDRKCNDLCALFEEGGDQRNGVIVHSDLLLAYLKQQYPGFYFVSSTTKVLTDFEDLRGEIDREDFRYVVPDFRLNKAFAQWDTLTGWQRDKVEFLCNECCWFGCGGQEALLRSRQPQKSRRKRRGASLRGSGCRGRLSVFQSDGQSGIYRYGRHKKYLPRHWDFPSSRSRGGDLAVR